jgi:glutamyl-tRNA synthetase
MVRVRLAPSPTGMMHIGTARLGLFVWLFARQKEGKFILRIEDTDKERYKKEFEESIINGLKSLGLDWDEFYKQSERTALYKEHLIRLIEEDKVYPCFCTKEELDEKRMRDESEKRPVIYSGKCASISKNEAEKRIASGEPHVFRFRMPRKKVSFTDMVRGEVEYDTSLIGDIVIAKNLEEPLYNFVVVVDDILMNISHVIRGEDHLPNTPKQIAIFEALGAQTPIFAHLPLILNSDRSKMSKRAGDTALIDFLSKGYLSEAIINFLALLSWHPKDEQEIFSISDLIKEFDISKIQKGGAVFDYQKLNWLNHKYISEIIKTEEIVERGQAFVPSEWKLTPSIINVVKSRLEKLSDLEDATRLFFVSPEYPKEMLIPNRQVGENNDLDTISNTIKNDLEKLLSVISGVEENDFIKENLEPQIFSIIPKDKKGEYLWPLRVAVSGLKESPGPFEIMEGLGKIESINRLKKALAKLAE